MKKFLCGSNYFFGRYKDYNLHDYDYIIIKEDDESGDDYKDIHDIKRNIDYFIWKKKTPDWHVNRLLNEVRFPPDIGHLLIPGVNKLLGITIDHLKKLAPILDELWDDYYGLYNYDKIIYEAYIKNNAFILTNDQRLHAYKVYKEARKDRYNIK